MLPIEDILPDLLRALGDQRRAVLQAPPGAGKTTHVPLALLQSGLVPGRIIMLEPRRLATRAAAARMAQTLGEEIGQTVGYRIRGEAKIGPSTRIEVVTEGILTRMLQDSPDLPGASAVIFDEFHERSLNADLGLALTLESAGALRDDLIVLVMSATLDAAPVAQMMQAPVLTSAGQAFDVTEHWLPKPLPKSMRFDAAMADQILAALDQAPGSLLAFLPGEGDIHRVAARLQNTLPDGCDLSPLYGALPFARQREALRPSPEGRRKVTLATAIAETSLTLPDIRIVVDGGRARRAVFDPGSGMSRLITERVTRAEARQRAGRAGRVADGHVFKLWTKGEDGALQAFPQPEIAAGDLTGFALELALWGAGPEDLAFVTPPHAGRLSESRALLQMLGALDAAERITDHGKALARRPLHPRLAHMMQVAGRQASGLAALLSERDPMRDAGADLEIRLRALADPRRAPVASRAALDRISAEAKRLARGASNHAPLSYGTMAALAYPDRIGLRRTGAAPRYLLSGGKGAHLPPDAALRDARLIVATDLDGDPRDARIRLALPLSDSDLREHFADRITWHDTCVWSKRDNRVLARRQARLGAIVLEDYPWHDAPAEDLATAMLEGVRQLGFPYGTACKRFLARAALMPPGFPDFSETHLMETLEDWLLPHLHGVTTASDWKAFDLLTALRARLSWDQQQMLDTLAPAKFETPLGRQVAIDYDEGRPAIAVRLQEMFGVTSHPRIGTEPLQITLLSPAGRPVQVTADLPGFWQTSYADVRKDMRGRYPKHPWPEDPTRADPTLRAKPRA